jgi:ribosome-associated translation inhibitor RaiA
MTELNFDSLTRFEQLVAVRAMLACVAKEDPEERKVEVEIKFNGVEVDFHAFCSAFSCNMDKMVENLYSQAHPYLECD